MRALLVMIVATTIAQEALFAQRADSGLGVEIRIGYTFPTGDLHSTETGPGSGSGLAIAGGVEYQLSAVVDLIAEASRDDFEGRGTDRSTSTSSGVGAGIRLHLRNRSSPWVKLGMLRHKLDTGFTCEPGLNVSCSATATGAIGGEIAVGFQKRLTRSLSIRPGVRYRRYTANDFESHVLRPDQLPQSLTVQYLVADVGIHLAF
jgi:hypothetical protein